MLLFMDGMAHYDTDRMEAKYTAVDRTDGILWTIAPEGRTGNCIKRVNSEVNTTGHLTIAPLTTRLGAWTPTTGGVCGFACKIDDLDLINDDYAGDAPVSPIGFFVVAEGGGTVSAGFHVRVDLNKTGTFTLRQCAISGGPNPEVILAQSTEGISEGAWHYLEFKWLIHDTAGTFAIRVNGVPVLTYAGPTRETSPFFASLGIWNAVKLLGLRQVGLPPPSPLLTVRICDLYLADLDSADPEDVSDFLGDGTIRVILPNGAGASTGWTPNTGANWAAADDDPTPDDDTTYVAATAPGLTDTYHFQDIPAGAVVKGVHVNVLARKEAEGAVTLAPIVHQGGTDYVGPSQGVADVTYARYLTQAWDLNPATGAKFTDSEVNAGQFGVVKVT